MLYVTDLIVNFALARQREIPLLKPNQKKEKNMAQPKKAQKAKEPVRKDGSIISNGAAHHHQAVLNGALNKPYVRASW